MNTDAVQRIQQILEYQFKNPQFLHEAFLHSSAANDRLHSNERLEFLGDSVLSLVICNTLFLKIAYPSQALLVGVSCGEKCGYSEIECCDID